MEKNNKKLDEEKRVQLENKFEQAMRDIYKRAKKECDYLANRFLQMVNERGGLSTAKFLLHEKHISEGFEKLWEKGRLDISVEKVVLNPEWKSLFTEEERGIAKSRLLDANFKEI